MARATSRSAWFIYALGSGWGHLNRALALATVAAQHRPVHVLTNSPYAEHFMPHLPALPLTIHQLSTSQLSTFQLSTSQRATSQRATSQRATSHSLKDARQTIQALLQSVAYDTLVIDTFPRGLVGELADVIPSQRQVCHVLIHRDLTPDYVMAKAVAAFSRQHYDGILIPGEVSPPLAHLPQVKVTAPWLSRDAAALADCAKIRATLGLVTDDPLIIVCGTGPPKELAFFGQLTAQLAQAFPTVSVRCLAARCPPGCAMADWICHWPGLEVLQWADVVVGSGGYNLVHECMALQVPLVAFAQRRKYDRQARRIRQFQQYGYLVEQVPEAIEAIASLLSAGIAASKGTAKAMPHYANGRQAAIAHIEAWRAHKFGLMSR
ncbi:MAG: UDP-N-acetylglucosamine--LPS N-acetylglucosamine transferase [Phormidesmis sp. RL_2_1]|nr:UDP-N-acetylglucosamine--LPS N-acetylglucosamine transferase [Phormidesmis sp. RL_2_1]